MTEQNIDIVKTRIWQVCSHVRGIMPDLQLQEVAIAFTFLRRIDCLIGKYAKECSSFYAKNRELLSEERLCEKLREISGGYPFYNHSGYTFKGILLANSSIEVVLNSYLQGFSYNILHFLKGMNFEQNLAILQRQSRYLVELFEFYTDLDLSLSSVDNEEFAELIYPLLHEGIRYFGENITYYELSTLISECLLSVDVREDKNERVSIYDPVCGTGTMLVVAGEKAKEFAIHQDNISLYGQEIAVFPCAIAEALVLLSGNRNSYIQYGDTLTEDMFANNHFQYILADNPFGVSWRPIQERIKKEGADIKGRFFMGLPAVNDSQFLFIEHIISKMRPEGSRAAFISNASALWAGNAQSGESRIRRWMFEHDLVESIIALPSGVHTVASIPIYLWILSNKKNEEQKGKVRLIDASSLVSKDRRNGLDREFVKLIVDEYQSKIISVNSQIVENDRFGFYEVDLLENGKKIERVAISLDTDIHEFVEKERQPYSKGEITIDYSSVEKGYSVQFEKFFTPEQTDITSLVDVTRDLVPVIDTIASLKKDIVKILGRSESKSWKEHPLRAATEVVFGVNRPPIQNNDGLPLLSVSYLRKPSVDDSLYEVSPKTKCSTVNDVIIIVRGENAGEVFKGVDGILSPSVAAIKCIDENIIAPQYLYYLLKGHEKTLRSLAKGVAIKSLDSKSIPNLKCMIPSIDEQIRLASYLDDIVGKIDNVINMIGNTGNVFSAYRQTLIENVVHGRVMVK